jgi:large subunit ribosomal protein L15
MPLQQRLPKFGFSSRVNNALKQLNLRDVAHLDLVSMETLREHKVIGKSVEKVKIFGEFELTKAVSVEGIKVSKGAKASIEKAGGKVN